jgi:MFS transporter, FHS family, glucose/mannose:H+ symporter
MVTVLPGPLLPVMAARWGLRDVQSGAFFAVVFAGSAIGSIFSPRWLRQNLPLGYAAMTAGLLLLAIAGQTAASMGHALALMAFALIGLGIGLSMTATNLTVAITAGGATPGERARRISLVNLWWGAGAVACPWLIAAAERGGYLRALLLLLALGTAGTFAALLPLWREPDFAVTSGARKSLGEEAGVLVYFAAFLFLYVGMETAVGGWITTYAHRFGGMTLAHASVMVSLFWMALLAGRWGGSLALRGVPERTVLLPGLGIALVATVLLVSPQSTVAVPAVVALVGAGFGPVFPIGISRMMARVQDHRNTGWVFAVTASGGGVLPWLTGLISTRSGSLRVGFAVPIIALGAILALAAGENWILGRQKT